MNTRYRMYHPGRLKAYYREWEINQAVLGFEAMYDGYEMAVVQFLATMKWWIVPNEKDCNDLVEAHGPFETMEDAVMQLTLMGDIIQPPIIEPENNEEEKDQNGVGN